MQAVERDCAIGPDLSEASENRSNGPPEISGQHADRLPMQGSRSETGCVLEAGAPTHRGIRSRDGRW